MTPADLSLVDGLSFSVVAGTALLFLRIGAFVALVPGFGETFVSARVKLGVAVALALTLWPTVVPGLRLVQIDAADLFLLAISETAFGVMLGLSARFAIHAVQIAATIIAQSSSLSQLLGVGAAPDPMPAIGNLLIIGAIALALAAGLHVKLVLALLSSYQTVAVGSFATASDGAPFVLENIATYFSLAVSLASPFLCFFFLVNLAFGVVNRAMPALMVSYIFAPFLTLAGLVLLALLLPQLYEHWFSVFDARLSESFG